MTVSTIGNVGADIARAQDKQNKQDSVRVGAKNAATLPQDRVDTAALQLLDVETARKFTEAENLYAARSTLSDADFAATESPQERVYAQAKEAIAAQTNKLPGNVLQLLNE